jgi:single-stranded DNA-specific DHH superfamily exonuclease
MHTDRLTAFLREARKAAAGFREAAGQSRAPATIVHHNDADGIAAAAALVYALRRKALRCRLLPIEKVHAPVVEAIHAAARGPILYADLGGQSCHLIDRYTTDAQHVVILDHHLPGAACSDRIVHLNPEHDGLSGDSEASGAAVCAFFAGELLREASSGGTPAPEALPALMGVIGAVGDRQMTSGTLTGLNRLLLETVIEHGEVALRPEGYAVPR